MSRPTSACRRTTSVTASAARAASSASSIAWPPSRARRGGPDVLGTRDAADVGGQEAVRAGLHSRNLGRRRDAFSLSILHLALGERPGCPVITVWSLHLMGPSACGRFAAVRETPCHRTRSGVAWYESPCLSAGRRIWSRKRDPTEPRAATTRSWPPG